MKSKSCHHKALFWLSVGYILVVSAFLIWHQAWFSPDQFFAAAILVTLFLGRVKEFFLDWFPFVGQLFGYEFLRSLVPKLAIKAHIFPMIRFDQAIFGFVPAVKLQQSLFDPTRLHWYDLVSFLAYISYFIVPMIVGFVLWFSDKETFRKYSMGIILLSYLAFVTFIIFPAVPPWMASKFGYIGPILDVANHISGYLPGAVSLPSLYQVVGANLVAAVPSLHAAMPWLVFLFLWRKARVAGVLFSPYVLAVWFAVVYLGEHYVFDIVVGVIYATTVFWLITKADEIRQRLSAVRIKY